MKTRGCSVMVLAVLAVLSVLGTVTLLVAAPVPLHGQGPVPNPHRANLPAFIRTPP